MPRLSLIAGIVVLIIIIVAGSYVGLTSLNPSQTPTPTPTATPSPSASAEPEASPQEQVRDDTIAYISSEHLETEPLTADLVWTGGRQDTMALGSETYLYTSGNWTLQIQYPVVLVPVYTITANYTSDDVTVQWAGTSEGGILTETSYTTIGLTPILSPTAQVREQVVAYIQTNYTDLSSYLQFSNWTGGRITPVGLAGYETYRYVGMGWNMTIGYVVYYDITYDVQAIYIPSDDGVVAFNWTGTVHNDNITQETCYINLPASLSVQSQVRDDVMTYMQTNHTETVSLCSTLVWNGTRMAHPMGMVGSETYSYAGINDGWNMTIQYPVVPTPIYTVHATCTVDDQVVVDWQGTVQNGTVTETSYTYTPAPSSSALSGGGNLPLTS